MTKIFESVEGNSPLPSGIHEVLGGQRMLQGKFYIAARNKACAVELGNQANLYASTRDLRVARDGNSYLAALLEQGKLLAEPGMIVATPIMDGRYALWADHDWGIDFNGLRQRGKAGEWQYIGESVYDMRTATVTYTPLGLGL